MEEYQQAQEPTPQQAPTYPKYPVSVSVDFPERSSRALAFAGLFFFVKALLIIPHAIVMYFLSIISFLLVIVNFIIVLFTGRQNEAIFGFLTGYLRWTLRINAYLYGLTDAYPPFRLEE